MTETQLKDSAVLAEKIFDEITKLPFDCHAEVFRLLKGATKERLLKESSVRQQEKEQIDVFIKEQMQ